MMDDVLSRDGNLPIKFISCRVKSQLPVIFFPKTSQRLWFSLVNPEPVSRCWRIQRNSSIKTPVFLFRVSISHCPSTNLQVRLLVAVENSQETCVLYLFYQFRPCHQQHSFTLLCLKMACIPSNICGHVQGERRIRFSTTKISEGISG